MAQDLPNSVLEQFASIVGPIGLVTDDADLAAHLTEWRGLSCGRTPVMLMPARTAEVAAVLRICQAKGIGVVPQGGNTGLVGGAIPHSSPLAPQILMSAARMNTVRALDPVNYTITAESGCLLSDVQEAAGSVDRLFPLSLAAEGSCQIGGNISTNAGGTNVLRYGNTRDLVMGLEVVLPDGSVFEGLRGLRKDNSGYDLKQLFVGAEGTLGFITAATCKLFPRPRSLATAIVAVPDPVAAVELHNQTRPELGDQLIAFELINRTAMELVLRHIPGTRDPLSENRAWYALLELGSARSDRDADNQLEEFLAGSMAGGTIRDGVLAQNATQREEFWRMRHSISEAQKREGAGIKHDISVPLSRMAEFIARAEAAAVNRIPGVVVVTFGHLGDGNLHFNLNQPPGMDKEAFLGLREGMSREIHTIAVELGGSFSAEHGIGSLKCDELERLTAPVELDLMRRVKKALDPAGIMNPGKIFSIIDTDQGNRPVTNR
jgi:FAD/FMN-containing dehydrogenase